MSGSETGARGAVYVNRLCTELWELRGVTPGVTRKALIFKRLFRGPRFEGGERKLVDLLAWIALRSRILGAWAILRRPMLSKAI